MRRLFSHSFVLVPIKARISCAAKPTLDFLLREVVLCHNTIDFFEILKDLLARVRFFIAVLGGSLRFRGYRDGQRRLGHLSLTTQLSLIEEQAVVVILIQSSLGLGIPAADVKNKFSDLQIRYRASRQELLLVSESLILLLIFVVLRRFSGF